MQQHTVFLLTGIVLSVFAHVAASQDETLPVVMALVLQDAEAGAGADPAKPDPWVAAELEKEKAGAVVIQRPWFRLTHQVVTLHDTKLHGTLTVRLAEPRDAQTLTVHLAGRKPRDVELPRTAGSTRLIRTEMEDHLGDKLTIYLALRVDQAAADAPAPLQIGEEANGKTVDVKGVSRILVRLPGNITTGFSWSIARIEGAAVQRDGEVQYNDDAHPPGVTGGGGVFEASLRVVAQGKATVTMEYRRPWEKEKIADKTLTVTLNVLESPAGK